MQKNISIIGIGRLGICVGLCLEKVGYNVLGLDIFPEYIDKINNKTLISHEPNVTEMLNQSKNFKGTLSLKDALDHSNIIFIYVATPSSGGNKHYDHTTLGKLLLGINKEKVKNKHIIIGCTVIPGYINQIGNFLIKDCENTSLSYNPEFIAQGDIINGLLNPYFILIGEGSKEAGEELEKIYKTLNSENINIQRMSPISAEITKLSINCFITTKISFANMIGDVADNSFGANKFDILRAVGSDLRIGNKYLKPGYGFGGPCFPRDNRALGSYIKSVGIEPLIPNATSMSNELHSKFQVDQIIKNNETKNIELSGVCYTDNFSVPIIEESQKLFIAEKLVQNNFDVTLIDKKIILDEVKLEYGNIFNYIEEESYKTYLYFNNKNYPIKVTSETCELTKYTFMNDGSIWESNSMEYFFSLIDKKKSYNVVDIGAQSGSYTLYAKYLPMSTFYSFEPFPSSFRLLNDNIKLNNIKNVKTFNTAISNKGGSAILNTCINHNGLHTLGGNVCRFTDIKPIEISTTTLDSFFYDTDTKVDFIKIDTEGYEYYILQGGIKTINKYKPIIQLEWNKYNLIQCNVTEEMLDNIITELDYVKLSITNEELIIAPRT